MKRDQLQASWEELRAQKNNNKKQTVNHTFESEPLQQVVDKTDASMIHDITVSGEKSKSHCFDFLGH